MEGSGDLEGCQKQPLYVDEAAVDIGLLDPANRHKDFVGFLDRKGHQDCKGHHCP